MPRPLKRPEQPIDPYKAQPLPLGRPAAVYYRQSSEGQIGNISTTLQTIDMIEHLLEAGAKISAYDPEASDNVQTQMGFPIEYATDQYAALEHADALLICTEWSAFRNPDFERMSGLMKGKVIFDGRNLYELPRMKELGWTYTSIGREVIHSEQSVSSK